MNPFNCPVWGTLLWPVSQIYGSFLKRRNRKYDAANAVHRLDASVISVGNITVGGTGKTPLVQYLARKLQEKGFRIGIISRGYRRKSSGLVVVSDGKKIRTSAREAGDEPFLLAEKTGAAVVVCSDRISAGQEAIGRFGCDVLIMDDGFQHRRLHRVLDMVVLDASNPWGNGRLLPAGPLREPLSSINRAGLVVMSRTDEARDLAQKMDQLNRYTDKPVFQSVHQPKQWVSMSKKEKVPLETLKGKHVLAFSGIGNPVSFFMTLRKTGVIITDQIVFPDHHWYSRKDWKRILKKAVSCHAEAIVTTEKDGVRFTYPPDSDSQVWMLAMEIGFQDEECFLKTVLSTLKLTGV